MAILLEDQRRYIMNITNIINSLKSENWKTKKEIELEKFLTSNFENVSEEKISEIKKILEVKKTKFVIEKDTPDFFILKGFFLKLKDLGFNFPVKKDKEVVFDFEDKFDISYLFETAQDILLKDDKEIIKKLVKEQAEVHGNDYKTIATILDLDEKKVEVILKRVENAKNVMRKANYKVKED